MFLTHLGLSVAIFDRENEDHQPLDLEVHFLWANPYFIFMDPRVPLVSFTWSLGWAAHVHEK